jgi:perosamine synthetase
VLEGASGSLILAMLSGRPVLVSDHGSYAEVPDGLVLKCRPGAEAADVRRHLEALLADPAPARTMAARARALRRSDLHGRRLRGAAPGPCRSRHGTLPAVRAAMGLGRTLAGFGCRWTTRRANAVAARWTTCLTGGVTGERKRHDTAPRRGSAPADHTRLPPDLSGNERRYVLECLDTPGYPPSAASSKRFEGAVRAATGAHHAIGLCNGTVALHLALHCLGVGPGDEVIVPTFTYIASVNTIAQSGATPVFADCREGDWLLDPADAAARVTPRTKAILPVHLYGAACDMPALGALAEARGLGVVEDCAEAFGTTLDGRHVGTFGDVGTFSFFGNKTITTGEGGMVISRDEALAERMRLVRGQGQSPARRYWHEVLGFNYRMTNIVAAIGLAQIERLDAILARKRAIAARYEALLRGLPVAFQRPHGRGRELALAGQRPAAPRRGPRRGAAGHGGPRRGHAPRLLLRPRDADVREGRALPVAEAIAARGLSLPSYPDAGGRGPGPGRGRARRRLRAQGLA